MGKTSRRIGCAVLIILLLIGAGGGIYWYLHQTSSNTQTTNTTSTTNTTNGITIYSDTIPASTAPFKAYHNTEAYHFTISYPSDWSMNTDTNGNALTVSFSYQVPVAPDDYPLEIDCDANPNGLSAQQWSATDPQSTPQAAQKLSSGVEAFVATGIAEGPYTAYTVVRGQQACILYAFETSSENTPLITKVINTFAWN